MSSREGEIDGGGGAGYREGDREVKRGKRDLGGEGDKYFFSQYYNAAFVLLCSIESHTELVIDCRGVDGDIGAVSCVYNDDMGTREVISTC